jgi:hypothetical protein
VLERKRGFLFLSIRFPSIIQEENNIQYSSSVKIIAFIG